MGNKLFQEARNFVNEALNGYHPSKSQQESVEIAENALSSAFANSTDAERVQLSELQNKLDEHKHTHH